MLDTKNPPSNGKITDSTEYIQSKIGSLSPSIGLILGSGLGSFADEILSPVKIKYENISGFSFSTVEGHAGQLVAGTLQGKSVIAMQGRLHYYEGYSLEDITLPIRVMKKLGVETIIITNAAGGVNRKFIPGDLMVISDHINFSALNPLRGKNIEGFGSRFPDMSTCYDPLLIGLVKKVAQSCNIQIQEGVYYFSAGPSFETPAEIRTLEMIGVDAVGMSTIPEVIVAVHSGLRVIGISCITNMAAGISEQKLSHAEVIETTTRVKEKFNTLLKELINQL